MFSNILFSGRWIHCYLYLRHWGQESSDFCKWKPEVYRELIILYFFLYTKKQKEKKKNEKAK